MKPMRMLIMLAAMWVTGTVLFAAEPTNPAPSPVKPAVAVPKPSATPPPAEPAAAAAPEAAKDAAGEQSTPSPVDEDTKEQKAPVAGGPSPQRFVPSEQVRADFDVSFPIDI